MKERCRKDPISNCEPGLSNPLRQQRREPPIAQDHRTGCDEARDTMWRASRFRIQASSTGSPSMVMELAAWRGMASKWRRRRSASGRLRQCWVTCIHLASSGTFLPLNWQQCSPNGLRGRVLHRHAAECPTKAAWRSWNSLGPTERLESLVEATVGTRLDLLTGFQAFSGLQAHLL